MINDLFSSHSTERSGATPLAHRLRPEEQIDYVGFEKLVAKYPAPIRIKRPLST